MYLHIPYHVSISGLLYDGYCCLQKVGGDIQLDDVPSLSYKSNEYITLFHHYDFNNNNSDFTGKAKNLDTINRCKLLRYCGLSPYLDHRNVPHLLPLPPTVENSHTLICHT